MRDDKKIKPFSCGYEYRSWIDDNCEECKHNYNPKTKITKCKFEECLAMASIDDGLIPEKLKIKFVGDSDMGNCLYKNCDAYEFNKYENESQLTIDFGEKQ